NEEERVGLRSTPLSCLTCYVFCPSVHFGLVLCRDRRTEGQNSYLCPPRDRRRGFCLSSFCPHAEPATTVSASSSGSGGIGGNKRQCPSSGRRSTSRCSIR